MANKSQTSDIIQLTIAITEAVKRATIQKRVNEDSPTQDTRLPSLWRRRTNCVNKYKKFCRKQHIKNAAKLSGTHWLCMCDWFNEHTALKRMWTVYNAMLGKRKEGNTSSNIALGANKKVEEILE